MFILTKNLYRYLEVLKTVIYRDVLNCTLNANHMHFVYFRFEIHFFLKTIRDRASTIATNYTIKNNPNIHLSIPRRHNYNTFCINYMWYSYENCLVTIMKSAKTQIFLDAVIYISSGNRWCKTHITKFVVRKWALHILRLSEKTSMFNKDI